MSFFIRQLDDLLKKSTYRTSFKIKVLGEDGNETKWCEVSFGDLDKIRAEVKE